MKKVETFEVIVTDYSSSVEEWNRALEAPRTELPRLGDEQKQVARKFGVAEEDYARGLLAGLYGQERLLGRGRELGQEVQRILDGLGSDHRVVSVAAEMFKGRWLVRIQAPERVFNVAVPRELADDVLDSGAMEEKETLRVCILSGLGRSELLSRS